MKLSEKQLERAAHRLIAECIAEAGPHDVPAALRAADILADTLPDEELRRLAGVDDKGKRRPTWWERNKGKLSRPMSAAERGADRASQRATLSTLDAALSTTAPYRKSIALALEDREPGKPVTLYGVTGPLPLIPAVSEQTDAALLYGEPEIGTASEGALQTAKEQAGRKVCGKGKAKGKAGRKRRGLFKRLRIKRQWAPGYIDPFAKPPL